MTAAMILETDGALRLACPQCHTRLGGNLLECSKCHAHYRSDAGIVSLNTSAENSNRSKPSAFGLLPRVAQWWLWSRKLHRNIQFCRDLLCGHKSIVEIAPAQGLILKKALAQKGSNPQAPLAVENLILLAANSSDLRAAQKNLPGFSPTLVEANLDKLPFEDRSVEAMGCSEGLHRVAFLGQTLNEISRVLAPTGRFRGSILLVNNTAKKSLLQTALQRSGIQKTAVDLVTFKAQIKKAGFTVILFEQQESICLFELAPTCH